MRLKFYQWLLNDVVGRTPGGYAPTPLHYVYYILFPLQSLHMWLHEHEGYQIRTDQWVIHGEHYSDMFFTMLNRSNPGDLFVLQKTEYGVVVKLYNPKQED